MELPTGNDNRERKIGVSLRYSNNFHTYDRIFETPTACTLCKCATELHHIPKVEPGGLRQPSFLMSTRRASSCALAYYRRKGQDSKVNRDILQIGDLKIRYLAYVSIKDLKGYGVAHGLKVIGYASVALREEECSLDCGAIFTGSVVFTNKPYRLLLYSR